MHHKHNTQFWNIAKHHECPVAVLQHCIVWPGLCGQWLGPSATALWLYRPHTTYSRPKGITSDKSLAFYNGFREEGNSIGATGRQVLWFLFFKCKVCSKLTLQIKTTLTHIDGIWGNRCSEHIHTDYFLVLIVLPNVCLAIFDLCSGIDTYNSTGLTLLHSLEILVSCILESWCINGKTVDITMRSPW